MLVIRFRRIGKKNKPSYRIVAAEHSFPVDGRFVADLGYYNPHTKALGLKKEEALEWLKKGAKPSNSVAKLLEREKIKHSSVVVVKKAKKVVEAAEEKTAEPAKEAAPAEPVATEEVSEQPEVAAEPTEEAQA